MSRLPFPDLIEASGPEARPARRPPVNLTRMLLHIPDAVEPYNELTAALMEHGRIEPRLRELVILRVVSLSGSACERALHVPAARQAGATEAEIASAISGHAAGLESKLALAFRFAEECARDVRVSEATLVEARGRFSPPEIAELTLLVGFFMMTARFLETLGVDDAPAYDRGGFR